MAKKGIGASKDTSKNSSALKALKRPQASMENLYRVFTIPEGVDTTLGKIDQQISTNLAGFLSETIVASTTIPADLELDFMDTTIDDDPIYVSEEADFLLKKVVAQSVHVSAPTFVGHMTSAIPYFMLPLAKIMIALNQNLVKIETSKAFTPLERQVIGMMHRLVYKKESGFYNKFTQNPNYGLGAFCSGGTIANITALWVALGKMFPRTKNFDGIAEEGLVQALAQSPYKQMAIVVSERGHYSFSKAANLLGIGRKNLILIPTDSSNKMRLDVLEVKLDELAAAKIGVIAVVGIAGTTETGNIDPLRAMAKILKQRKIFFHVDAAWGGPTLFSEKYCHLLDGIDLADSVTIDAHKQLYVPMGTGLVVFKDSKDMNLIEHSAQYVIRKGSRDLGKKTLEGSRPGMAMLVHSGLKVIGKKGYGLLVNLGIEKAQKFAEYIKAQKDFELITEPELNILTYRYFPLTMQKNLAAANSREKIRLYEALNQLTISIQKEQRESGKTFVSRTSINPHKYDRHLTVVFRVVLANPLTTDEILQEIIAEQRQIALKLLRD